jgi:hypothetical protein
MTIEGEGYGWRDVAKARGFKDVLPYLTFSRHLKYYTFSVGWQTIVFANHSW